MIRIFKIQRIHSQSEKRIWWRHLSLLFFSEFLFVQSAEYDYGLVQIQCCKYVIYYAALPRWPHLVLHDDRSPAVCQSLRLSRASIFWNRKSVETSNSAETALDKQIWRLKVKG